MRVLITGGLGFIGSFIAERFISHGDRVVIVDDLSSNVVDDVPGAEVWLHDMRSSLIPADGLDLVVHCASPVGSVGVLSRQGTIVEDIVENVSHAAWLCRELDIPLVYLSSSEVYGFSGIYSETDELVVHMRASARQEYAVGKIAGESLVLNQIPQGLKATIIRPFNVAGPRQRKELGFVLPTFVQQALAGEPITVYGNGTQERALTAVSDVARFVVDHLADFEGRIYNVGAPRNFTTINDLAELVKEVTNSDSEIVHVDPREIHPGYEEAVGHTKVPLIERALQTGWQPLTDLSLLVAQTAAEYKTPEGLVV